MQGTLTEIDLRSILQLIELGQRTGQLLIEARLPVAVDNFPWESAKFPHHHPSTLLSAWLVFFVNGRIIYATDDRSHSLGRLGDYLTHYHLSHRLEGVHQSTAIANTTIPEYAALWFLLEEQIITVEQARQILQAMLEETLFDLLSLHHGYFTFQINPPFSPQLATYAITPFLFETIKKVQKWKQLHPHIQLPQQRLLLTHPEQLATALPATAYQKLMPWITGSTSLRQLARYLNRDLVALAKALLPYIQKGWIQVLEPTNFPSLSTVETMPEHQVPRILCIDDDVTIGKTVEEILRPQGYEVHLVHQSLQAIEAAFRVNPDLILCDVMMPDLDGNEICLMLRHGKRFQEVPIVMLTGKEGFLDRMQATFAGATDYLTKPFGQQELLALLEKYLPNPIH
ncbi:response regulator [Synechococcus moorigangaii CMS01]|nr:response regulator [Synechococcus moorigangaii CMS01]